MMSDGTKNKPHEKIPHGLRLKVNRDSTSDAHECSARETSLCVGSCGPALLQAFFGIGGEVLNCFKRLILPHFEQKRM